MRVLAYSAPVRGMLAAVVATLLWAASAAAQSWPDRPVKVIIPFPPGGATGGAGGMIGVEAAVKSNPDGYTLLLCSNSPLVILPHLRKTPYDAIKQLVPVARVGDMVGGFAVHPNVGVHSMAELIAHAKANPGKLIFGSAGLGTATHLRVEVLKLRAGADILHIPYRGSGDALTDLLSGTVHLMSENVVLPHVKAGKLKLLAMNHHERHWDYPDVPTLRELGIENADIPIWFSIWAPTGTPREIVDRLNAKVVEIAKTEDMRTKLRGLSFSVPLQSPAEIARELAEDSRINFEIIRAANVKLDP